MSDKGSEVRLPPALETLWGRRTPSSRGPRAELDVDRIVRTAVAIANADGLDAVSMARVAKELGFTTMSLYRHVSSKDELFQLMWNASALDLQDWRPEGATWRERLMSWVTVQRKSIEANIWIVQLPMSTPPLAPASLAWVELGLGTLEDVEAPDYAKIRLLGLVSQHALIHARMVFDERRAREAAAETGVETDYGVLVRELADPETYPLLWRVSSQPPPEAAPGPDEETEFLFDVTMILDGFEAQVARGYSVTEE
jgi:AcrR family transcriptional regulator